jgi:hypothetical protein
LSEKYLLLLVAVTNGLFYLDIAGIVPLATHPFATPKKSDQTNFAGSKIEQLSFSWPLGKNTRRVL